MSAFLTHSLSQSVKRVMSAMGLSPSAKILAGVSGGVDSMVLLFILHKLGFSVSAAHVNFNLRGAESHNDALFVKKWCLEQGIPFYELLQDTREYAEIHQLNIQTAARNIRYAWWEQLVHKHQFEVVATAHHLDDAIETLFLNLLRGTGLKGLKSIPLRRDFYIRPLLHNSRKEIETFAIEWDIPFRTDSSNNEDAYQRNKIRNHLIPILEQLQPGFHASMQHTLHRVNLEWEGWEYHYELWQNSYIQTVREGLQITSSNHDLPFLLRWLEEKGIPWNLSYDFLTASHPDSGHTLDAPPMRLSRTEGGYFLEEIRPPIQIVIPQPGHYVLGSFTFSIESAGSDIALREHGPGIEYVSGDTIRWPLYLRNVRAGDTFQPLGMEGKSKKIQDLMVDFKLEMHEKSRLLLLTNDDHCIWVVGLRLDERAKVKEKENVVFKLTITSGE